MQNAEDKSWKNEELRKLEEALPKLKRVCELEKVSRLYKAKTGLGWDGFHPKVPLHFTKIVEFVEKAEQSGKWPQQACMAMFFLIPKNITSDRPVALVPTLIRWWEAFEGSGSGKVAAEVSPRVGRYQRAK